MKFTKNGKVVKVVTFGSNASQFEVLASQLLKTFFQGQFFKVNNFFVDVFLTSEFTREASQKVIFGSV